MTAHYLGTALPRVERHSGQNGKVGLSQEVKLALGYQDNKKAPFSGMPMRIPRDTGHAGQGGGRMALKEGQDMGRW